MAPATVDDEQSLELEDSLPPKDFQTYPWLLINHAEDCRKHTFFSISQNRYQTKRIQDLRDKYIFSTYSSGWLVMRGPGSMKDCFLLNLVSMEKIQLPPIDFTYHHCFLASTPDDLNCHILLGDYSGGWYMFHQLGRGNEYFRKKVNEDEPMLKSVITVKGKTYGLTTDNVLLSIEFEGPTLRFTRLIEDTGLPPISPHAHCSSNYLVELSGEILCVLKVISSHFTREVLDFLLFKANLSTMEWVPVKNIGTSTIFLHHASPSMSCDAIESEIKNNSIYYLDTDFDQNLYVWNLSDKTSSIYLPCPSMDAESMCHWVMLPATASSS